VQKDPLIITVQKRDQTISATQFISANSVAFDPAGAARAATVLAKASTRSQWQLNSMSIRRPARPRKAAARSSSR